MAGAGQSTAQPTVKIEVMLTKKEEDLLNQLLATGLYGLSPAHVVERLVSEGLLRRLQPGDLLLRVPRK